MTFGVLTYSNVISPILSGGLAVIISGFNGEGWMSGRTWVNALQLTGSLLVGSVASSWLPIGIFGAGRALTNSAVGGVVYGGIRKYYDRDSFFRSFGYGLGLGLAGDVLTAPFNSLTGLAPRGSEVSNISAPPGIAVPADIRQLVNVSTGPSF